MDTKSLDGETNLKEKLIHPKMKNFCERDLGVFEGFIDIDIPNGLIDHCEARLVSPRANFDLDIELSYNLDSSNFCSKELL